MKKYMILDSNNVVLNVLAFADDHNEDLSYFVQITPNGSRFLEITSEEGLFGVGLVYSDEFEKCIPEQPYPSWIWDEVEWQWISPIPVPDNPENYRYIWDEENMLWILSDPAAN